MSVRQYIGARYVIKIYENSLDPSSAEWEANVNYEPLTMVTFSYGSYLSKKEVPASVGNPADNPTYWAQNGSYNGQIANLQNRVTALENEPKRHYIVIGDSFSYGSIDSQTIGRGWIEQLTSDFYPNATITYLTLAQAEQVVGVSGFASTKPFLSMLQQIEYFNPDLDKNEITDIVVIGGTNDIPHTKADIMAAEYTFCSYCKTNYPNARIRIGIFGVTVQNAAHVVEAYQRCVEYGANFMFDLWGIVATKSHLSDGTHIDQTGYDTYCPYIADAIINDKTSYTSIGSGYITPIAAGDTDTYGFDVITTAETTSIEFNKPIIPVDSVGTGYTTITGDAVIISLGEAEIPLDIYGYDGTSWTYAGAGRAWFANDGTRLYFEPYQISPAPIFTTYRYVLHNTTMQKRVYSTLS